MRSRIARFVMRRRATAIGALVLVFVMAGTALAVAPGSNFRLGVINSISGYLTTLTGSNNGAMLAIKNTNTNTGARGLSINVAAGRAPIVVNGTAGKATGLNADKVDGKNANQFLAATGKAVDADKVDGIDSGNLLPGGILPAGRTIRGSYAAGHYTAASGEFSWDQISFGYTLSAAPAAHFVPMGSTPPAECPGSATSPQAAAGHLCVYEAVTFDSGDTRAVFNPANGSSGTASAFGAGVYVVSDGVHRSFSYGSWAVTSSGSATSSAQSPARTAPVGSGN